MVGEIQYTPVKVENMVMRSPITNNNGEATPPTIAEVSSETTTVERLTELLRNYGMKVTEENTAMLKLMLENGIPLTEENVKRMNQALKLTGTFDKALFMLQNNIKMNSTNATQLDGLVSGKFRITDQLSNLFQAIEQLEDSTLASKLKQILLDGGQQSTGKTMDTVQQHPQLPLEEIVKNQNTQQSHPQLLQREQQVMAKIPQSQTDVTVQTTQSLVQTTSQQTSQSLAQVITQQTAQPSEQAIMQQSAQSLGQVTTQQATQSPGQTTTQQITQLPKQEQALQQLQEQTVGKEISSKQVQFTAQQAQSAETQTLQSQSSGLLFRLEDSTPQDIDRFLNNLRNVLGEVRQVLAGQQDSPDAARVLQEVRSLESHIDFTSQIRNQLFVQLPLYYGGQQSLASLFVHKDSKKSGKGSSGGASSALIALETSSLGHFETYVQKNSRSVHCQFRLESTEIINAVRANIHKLDALLRDSNYTLDSFSFLPLDEPYTLLDSPRMFESDNLDGHIDDDILHFDKKA